MGKIIVFAAFAFVIYCVSLTFQPLPKGADRYRTTHPQANETVVNTPQSQEQPLQSDTPLNRFRAQVLLDTQVTLATSPSHLDPNAWTDRKKIYRARSLFGAVQISPALIDAAVAYWAAKNNLASENTSDARSKLTHHFLRPGQKCFLLVVDAIGDAHVPRLWRLHLEPVDSSVTIKTLDGDIGEVVVAEQSLKNVLESQDGTCFCLCYMQDVVDEDTDPTFMIEWGGINYAAYEQVNKYPNRPNSKWIKTTSPQVVKLKFETGEVPLLSLLENDGISWEEVHSLYITPHYNTLNQSSGVGGSFLIDKAVDLIIGLVIKKFP